MTDKSTILFGKDALTAIHEVLKERNSKSIKLFLVTDQNTYRQCVPLLNQLLGLTSDVWTHITIPAGESFKTIDTVVEIWDQLTAHTAGRDAVVLNLGGGVVTDIGGFAASCFKRGIRCIHLPTTLLGMTDAAIGGKTGIDFNYLKNHIGTFYPPEKVLILPGFLETLPADQILSGYGEVLKYGFIASPELLAVDPETFTEATQREDLIRKCTIIKEKVTREDPVEKGIRKILNFGHTAGHAFESFALENKLHLLHGHAVASGILVELYLSQKMLGLDNAVLVNYSSMLQRHFKRFVFSPSNIDDLIVRMGQDKKNTGSRLRFVLIKSPGTPVYDVEVQIDMIKEALLFYLNEMKDESIH